MGLAIQLGKRGQLSAGAEYIQLVATNKAVGEIVPLAAGRARKRPIREGGCPDGRLTTLGS